MINLVSTEFKDLTNGSTYGYRIYDDHGKDYYNLLTEPITDNIQLLKLAMIENPEFFMHFDNRFLVININGTVHRYQDIKEFLL